MYEEERKMLEEERKRHEEEQMQIENTTFLKYIQHYHESLLDSLKVDSFKETNSDIPIPTTQFCPKRLEHWSECDDQQQQIYQRICEFLEPHDDFPMQLFDCKHYIQHNAKTIKRNPIRWQKGLEIYVHDSLHYRVEEVIEEICGIPLARAAFNLVGDRMKYTDTYQELQSRSPISIEDSEQWTQGPESFYIHDVHAKRGGIARLVGELRLPNKLTLEVLRAGLRPVDFYAEVVKAKIVARTEAERIAHNATRLVGAALVQVYNKMISYGFEYGYIATGQGLILLQVPQDNPSTLLYHFCEPNQEATPGNPKQYLRPVTAIARVLCLCMMSCASPRRSPDWCAKIQANLPIWLTGFDYEHFIQTHNIMPSDEFSETTISSSRSSGCMVPARQSPTKTCSQSSHSESEHEASGNKERHQHRDSAQGLKRRSSMTTIPSSSSERQLKRPKLSESPPRRESKESRPFCTHKCLLGLKRRGKLDTNCPNYKLHQENGSRYHRTNSHGLVKLIKGAILSRAEPMGKCGLSGAPFKITCPRYGYTIVGKGTTCYLWPQLKREADIYRMLQPVQGSAIPVFIGKLDMRHMIFLWGAGKIRHMLLMGWGGEESDEVEVERRIMKRSLFKPNKDIKALGIIHRDLEWRNVLWSAELNRAVIIDFHLCTFDMDLVKKKPKWLTGENPMLEGIKKDQERLHCEYHGVCLHPPDGKSPNLLLDIY